MKKNWSKSCIDMLIVIIILTISITCLVSMLLCINTFIQNLKTFSNAYTEATTALVGYINNDVMLDDLSNALTYLESLQLIQKSSTTNDLMSFIYNSFLSTILVGLCAGFVMKSKKNADETHKVALEAQGNAQKAEISKKSAEKIHKETEDNVKSTEQLKLEALKHIAIHKTNITILLIHIEITHARYFLDTRNQVEANKRLYEIDKKVSSLDEISDISSIRQLRNELLVLKSDVDSFTSFANDCGDNNKKTSMQQASTRYYKQLANAISTCDSIIRLGTNNNLSKCQ